VAQIWHHGARRGAASGEAIDGKAEILAALIRRAVERGAVATAGGLAVHYLLFYLLGAPLWTEVIGEWIMARTPNAWSVWLLSTLGAWAKPFALTGGLAVLGLAMTICAALPVRGGWIGVAVLAAIYQWVFEYPSVLWSGGFWFPALGALIARGGTGVEFDRRRRMAVHGLMAAVTGVVAGESFLRNERTARRAVKPVPLWPFAPPLERFAAGWVRRAVTLVGDFYTMSKNSVDPVIDPATWRLRITIDGRTISELRYAELMQAPRLRRYVTLRCVSNTLHSDLMGTAEWSGFLLRQIVDPVRLPPEIREVAFLGVDGHGDSLPIDYAFSGEVMLAVGMNGETLHRAHGFPVRLLCPRYYGFKHVKWLGEIAFRSEPYFGTWPKLGYTKEPRIKIASHIDKARYVAGKIRVAGVSFAGSRGIRRVQVREPGGAWRDAQMEPPLSPYTWTRWWVEWGAAGGAKTVEARAQDGEGNWQLDEETPLFPDGVGGPTSRRVSA
jgi:DMSO/TMAO reductase YedYZ molybdopterin-dependent catalytic subunit